MKVFRPGGIAALMGFVFLMAGCGSSPAPAASSHHAHHKAGAATGTNKKPALSTTSSGASGPFVTSQDPSTKTVTLSVTAGATIDNFYYNFNGFDQGNATITVPVGWTVKVDFSNESGSANSVVIAPSISNLTPAFSGAASPDVATGIQAGESQTFQFVAKTAGSYVLACGVPGQASQDGMWVKFVVSASASRASSQKS